jgi:hypothetical protein
MRWPLRMRWLVLTWRVFVVVVPASLATSCRVCAEGPGITTWHHAAGISTTLQVAKGHVRAIWTHAYLGELVKGAHIEHDDLSLD